MLNPALAGYMSSAVLLSQRNYDKDRTDFHLRQNYFHFGKTYWLGSSTFSIAHFTPFNSLICAYLVTKNSISALACSSKSL